MLNIWKQSPQFLPKSDDTILHEWNDDLGGFFNAVLGADIVTSVQWLVREYQETTGHELLSVHVAILGSLEGDANLNLRIVSLSFEGTCAGNQISPVLSGLPQDLTCNSGLVYTISDVC